LPAGKILRQGNEILLRLAQIPGLQILAQLLEFALNLLKFVLHALGDAWLKQTAGNS
jgi:hypothetical protein